MIVMGGSCWIRSGTANLVFFGAPIAIIIVVNAIYYFLTIYNIRQKKRAQKQNKMRRFSRVKLPGDEDLKFYIQMAVIMGFTWISGFLLMTFPNYNVWNWIVTYAFIFLNALNGVFILFAFLFKKEVKVLYSNFFAEMRCCGMRRKTNRVCQKKSSRDLSATNSSTAEFGTKVSRLRENSQCSTAQLVVKDVNKKSGVSRVVSVTESVDSRSVPPSPRLETLSEEASGGGGGGEDNLVV